MLFRYEVITPVLISIFIAILIIVVEITSEEMFLVGSELLVPVEIFRAKFITS